MISKEQLKPGSRFAVLFHKAWGQAKGSPEYDKKVWMEMDKMLFDCPDQPDIESTK